jgi:hypothetical protein
MAAPAFNPEIKVWKDKGRGMSVVLWVSFRMKYEPSAK